MGVGSSLKLVWQRQSDWDLSWLTINLQQLVFLIQFGLILGFYVLQFFFHIAKDCLLAGQEQACTRNTRSVRCYLAESGLVHRKMEKVCPIVITSLEVIPFF